MSLLFKKHVLLLVLTLTIVSPVWSAAKTKWTFHKDNDGWNIARNLKAKPSKDGLVLQVTGAHSHIANYNLNFDPKKGGLITIEYKASGFPDNTLSLGRLFFATAKDLNLDERKKIPLGKLTKDGRWHTLKVDVRHTSGGDNLWYDGGKIVKMRLDLIPQFPGTITIKKIEFSPSGDSFLKMRKIPTKVPAKLGKRPEPRKFIVNDPHKPYFKSAMVAPAKYAMRVGSAYIRRKFNLSSKVKKATLQISADDQINAIYINGKKLSYKWSKSWKETDLIDLTNMLTKGNNLIAIHYHNRGLLGGVMFDIGVELANNKFELITANDSLAAYGKVADNWFAPNFNGKGFLAPELRKGSPYEPWHTALLNYVDMRPIVDTAKVVNIKVDEANAEVVFSGKPKFRSNEIYYARILRPDGSILTFNSGTADDLNAVQLPNGDMKVTFNKFDLPRYGGKLTGMWEFGIYGRNIDNVAKKLFSYSPRPYGGSPLKIETVPTANGLITKLNGNPFYFNILTLYKNISSGMEGKQSPFNVIAFRAGGLSNHWWIGPNKYDFTEIDRRLSEIISIYPDSKLGLTVWCQPGLWYHKLYPERISRQDNNLFMHYYVSTVTFSDLLYRNDAKKAITALIKHCEKYFGSKVVFYNLMGGVSCEWQGWNTQTTRFADYGLAAQRDFAKYLRKNAPDIAESKIPSRDARLATDQGTLFRNPLRDRLSILYDQYYSESISECIAEIAKSAKKACHGNKLIGAYYGYHLEYANLRYAAQSGGHNMLWQLLKSPDIDFLLSPQSYSIRSLGAPNADMKPFSSIALHNKFSMIEDDTRTHLIWNAGFSQTMNMEHTLAVLRRNLAMSLCRKKPLNFLPLVAGSEFNDPKIRKDFQKALLAGQRVFERNLPRLAEIAVVIDEQSIKYLAPSLARTTENDIWRFNYAENGTLMKQTRITQTLTGDLLSYQRIALGQIGAPLDYLLLEDLIKNAKRYKLVILLNSFHDSEVLRQAIAAVRDADATLLSVYGTGFITKSGIDVNNMSDLLGIKLEKIQPGSPALIFDNVTYGQSASLALRFACKDPEAKNIVLYPNSKDVAVAQKGKTFFYGGTALSPFWLRKLADEAGVRAYLPAGDNLEIGSGIVMIHAASAGMKVLTLPEKTQLKEIFTGELLKSSNGIFKFPLKAFETKVFEIP